MAGDITPYLALIPPENNKQPDFMAVMAMLLQPLADQLQVTTGMFDLFDLDEAVGQQLDFVGQWIGPTRYLEVALPDVYFSFDVTGLGFDQGVWAPNGGATVLTALPDAQYRLLLYATVATNHWDGTVPGAETALNSFWNPFGYWEYIIDNQDMTMTFLLVGPPLNAINAALYYGGFLDVVPAGVGVADHIWILGSGGIPTEPLFGFDEENVFISGFDVGYWDGGPGNLIFAGSMESGGLVEVVPASFGAGPLSTSLLHFQGSNGSTTFTDVYGTSWAQGGSGTKPVISTADNPPLTGQTSSLYCNGSAASGDIQTPGTGFDALMGMGYADFTIECWVKTSTANTACLLGSTAGSFETGLAINSSGQLALIVNTAISGTINSSPTVVNDGAWHAVAYSRQAGVGNMYVDGTRVYTAADTTNYGSVAAVTQIGGGIGGAFVGYIGEARVTVGLGRYTGASYTVATAPFAS